MSVAAQRGSPVAQLSNSLQICQHKPAQACRLGSWSEMGRPKRKTAAAAAPAPAAEKALKEEDVAGAAAPNGGASTAVLVKSEEPPASPAPGSPPGSVKAEATTPSSPQESIAAWVASNELRREKLAKKAEEREAKAKEREAERLRVKAAREAAKQAAKAAREAAKAAEKEAKREAKAEAAAATATAAGGEATPAKPKRKRARGAAAVPGPAEPLEAVAADAEEEEPGAALCSKRRKAPARGARAAVAAEAVRTQGALAEEGAEMAEAAAAPKARRRAPKGKAKAKAEAEAAGGEEPAAPPEEGEGDAGQTGKKKARPRKKKGDPDDYEIPTRDVLMPRLLAAKPPPRPVPNLGYCCLNMELKEMRPPVFTNRDCVKKSFDEKGLPFISQLSLENCRSLPALIQWNAAHNIRLFRVTSNLFPWCTEYELHELPDFPAIREALALAGDAARAADCRLTFHPSHFVKLASPDEAYLLKSIKELEVHSQIFDLMGYEPSPVNKINIHIGGRYGDKASSLERFAAGFRRLSPGCQARLTVENDDLADSYSLRDLLTLHKDIGCPLVFDFHHHKFCPGDMTEKEALEAALATWPPGVRPVVHWSESQEGRKPQAHSDYIQGPLTLHGHEAEVDVQLECKCKERALLRYRAAQEAGPAPELGLLERFV